MQIGFTPITPLRNLKKSPLDEQELLNLGKSELYVIDSLPNVVGFAPCTDRSNPHGRKLQAYKEVSEVVNKLSEACAFTIKAGSELQPIIRNLKEERIFSHSPLSLHQFIADDQWKTFSLESFQNDEPSLMAIRALKKIVAPVILERLEPYFSKKQKILEIGAGALDHLGETHLCHLLQRREGKEHKWTYADQGSVVSAMAPIARQYGKSYLSLDLTDTAAATPGSYDCIVGENVLDTMTQEDLPKAFQKIHSLLKEGGFFIHLMTQPPYPYACLQAHAGEDKVLLPQVHLRKNSKILGIYVVKKMDYEQLMTKYRGEGADFFQKWGKLSPEEQMLALVKSADDGRPWEISLKVKEIFGEKAVAISHFQWGNQRLQKAAQSPGWKVRKPSGSVTTTRIIPASEMVYPSPRQSLLWRYCFFSAGGTPTNQKTASYTLTTEMGYLIAQKLS